MSTQLLAATLGAQTGTESPAKIAITPGVIGVTITIETPGGGLTTVPIDAIRLKLYSANIDITSPSTGEVTGDLAASALGEVLPAIDAAGNATSYSHDDFLATGEFLYAVVQIDHALSDDITITVDVSEA